MSRKTKYYNEEHYSFFWVFIKKSSKWMIFQIHDLSSFISVPEKDQPDTLIISRFWSIISYLQKKTSKRREIEKRKNSTYSSFTILLWKSSKSLLRSQQQKIFLFFHLFNGSSLMERKQRKSNMLEIYPHKHSCRVFLFPVVVSYNW